MQYTLRNIPPELDRALRKTAKEQHKSLNRVAIEFLLRAMCGAGEKPLKHRDLSDIVGSWEDDAAIKAALADQRHIDSEF